jgi:hypothetical protein
LLKFITFLPYEGSAPVAYSNEPLLPVKSWPGFPDIEVWEVADVPKGREDREPEFKLEVGG